MRRSLSFLAALGFVIAGALPGNAQSPEASATIIRKLFAAPTVDSTVFNATFLAAVPPPAIAAVLDDYRNRLGTLATVSKTAGTDYAMTFERGTLLASISLDAGGKIGGLVFHDETNDATRAALERFFTDRAPSAASFSDAFLAHIPLAQIAAITAQIKASEGKFVRLDLRDGAYYAVFEKAENHVQAALDATSKFTLLLLRPATARTSRV